MAIMSSNRCLGGHKFTDDKCEWHVTMVRDAYGIRTEHLNCRTCMSNRVRTGPAPTLGDRHYRED